MGKIYNYNPAQRIYRSNDIYKICFSIHEYCIFIQYLEIKKRHRKKGNCRNLINDIQQEFKKDIFLECFPTLEDLYYKLGFIKTAETYDGYFEMYLKYDFI